MCDGATTPIAVPKKARGFVPQNDKSRIIADKRPDLLGGQDSNASPVPNAVFGEVDSSVETTSDVTIDPTQKNRITFEQDEYDLTVQRIAQEKSEKDNRDLVAQIEVMKAEYTASAKRSKDGEAILLTEIKTATEEVSRLKNVFSATGNSKALADSIAEPEVDRPYTGGYIGSTRVTPPALTATASDRAYGYNINTTYLPSSAEPQGAARDFVDMLQNPQYTPRTHVFDDGEPVEQLDSRQIDRFFRENRVHVMRDMERLMKGNGLLRGSSDIGRDSQAGPTLGVAGSIRDAFLPFLSSLMRSTHQPRYIFHQFATERLELGRVPGTTILVPRYQWLDDPIDLEDYLLDSSLFSASISPESQALQMLTTPVQLFGYGLGKGSRMGTRPIAIPEFIQASSLVELQNALYDRLGQNYNAFEDLAIRRIFQQTLQNPANIYYNNGGEVTSTPSVITAGRDGTTTEEVLNSLASEMTRRQIPTYGNGLRMGVINTYSTTQLKNSLGDKLRANTESEIQEITNILNAGTLGDSLVKPNGYIGSYCGFMLFESGTIGIGLPGQPNSDGVTNNIYGAGTSFVARDNLFFGPGVVGKGTSLPMSIRMDDSGSFGTKMRFIWRSMEGWGSLDCTSTNPGQQDRVLVLRNSDRLI